MSGHGVIRLVKGGAVVPCVAMSSELSGVIRDAGYDPRSYNAIRWPVGLSRHASGSFLVESSALNLIAVAGVHRWTLTIGPGSSPVSFGAMSILAPRPILIHGPLQAPRLFAVDVVDARYFARGVALAENYNALDASGSGLIPSTYRLTDTPWTYDFALSDIVLRAGLGVLTFNSSTTREPIDVRGDGASAVEVADELAAETGRVLVLDYSGLGVRIESVSARTVLAALSPLAGSIMHGGVRYATAGVAPTGILGASTPVSAWSEGLVPGAVTVVMTERAGASATPRRRAIVSSVTATSLGLASTVGYSVSIGDAFVVSDPLDLTAATQRADAIADAYYRRYVAGACDVLLAGAHQPPLGGSIQCVEVRQSPSGWTTRAWSDFDAPVLGMRRIRSDMYGGAGIEVSHRTGGGVVVAASKIYARITGATQIDTDWRWAYDWVQVIPTEAGGYATGAMTSEDEGAAYNANESGNGATGTLGAGYSVDTLPSGFAPRPVGIGCVVTLSGPYVFGDPATQEWRFEATNHVDGECQAGGAP